MAAGTDCGRGVCCLLYPSGFCADVSLHSALHLCVSSCWYRHVLRDCVVRQNILLFVWKACGTTAINKWHKTYLRRMPLWLSCGLGVKMPTMNILWGRRHLMQLSLSLLCCLSSDDKPQYVISSNYINAINQCSDTCRGTWAIYSVM